MCIDIARNGFLRYYEMEGGGAYASFLFWPKVLIFSKRSTIMSLGVYLWVLRFCVCIALVSFLFVVFQIDPEKSGVLGKTFFFLSLFLLLSGVFVLLFTSLRQRLSDPEGASSSVHVGVSFRQGVLLSILGCGLLYLEGNDLLVWWVGVILVGATIFVELYFLTKLPE